jgi:hypothetical protein
MEFGECMHVDHIVHFSSAASLKIIMRAGRLIFSKQRDLENPKETLHLPTLLKPSRIRVESSRVE